MGYMSSRKVDANIHVQEEPIGILCGVLLPCRPAAHMAEESSQWHTELQQGVHGERTAGEVKAAPTQVSGQNCCLPCRRNVSLMGRFVP